MYPFGCANERTDLEWRLSSQLARIETLRTEHWFARNTLASAQSALDVLLAHPGQYIVPIHAHSISVCAHGRRF